MSLVLIATVLCWYPLIAQYKNRLNPLSAVTDYSFQVAAGTDIHVRVRLDDNSTIAGTSLFHGNDQVPFQTLSPCNKDLPMALYEGDERLALVEHGDFNFDGFEDLKVLQYVNDHLGKSLFCVYLWDKRSGQFREEPRLFGDPQPDPKNKTLFFHEEYFGGPYRDETYVWRGDSLVVVETKGLLYGSGKPGCGFTSFCERLVNGKMQKIDRPTACGDDGVIEEANCPTSVPAPGK